MMNKRHANQTRQIVDKTALDACDASYAAPILKGADPDFKAVTAFRAALVNVVYEMPDLAGLDIINRFNEDVFKSIDIRATLNEWRVWFRALDDAVKARDEAKQALGNYDKDGWGGPGYWLAVETFTGDRDEAQATIDRLKDGPEPDGSEGLTFDDPNYVPFIFGDSAE